MCAMLALVAPKELDISQARVTRFLDSYIGEHFMFMKFRMHIDALGTHRRASYTPTIAYMCCIFA
jgi:hypothetical protein